MAHEFWIISRSPVGGGVSFAPTSSRMLSALYIHGHAMMAFTVGTLSLILLEWLIVSRKIKLALYLVYVVTWSLFANGVLKAAISEAGLLREIGR